MANNTANVTAGQPKESGGAYRAPVGSTLPTDASAALDAAFQALGYVSDAGLTNSFTQQHTEIKDWGGQTVLVTSEQTTDNFQLVLLESKALEVLKAFFGADNVSGTLATGITIKANRKQLPPAAYVFELEMSGGGYHRIVLPKAQLYTRADRVFVGNNAVGYGLTLSCLPDAEGNSHYEYMIQA